MQSKSFDQAASDYEAARGFPPIVAEAVADATLALLGPGRRVLEVGVGTGRIARPLLARHVALTGLDLSRAMLDQLLLHLQPDAWRPPLVQADAVSLPFATAAFDAVLTVHLLQLLANWPVALAEARRVLRPGGMFLSGFDWRPPDSPGARLLVRWREILGAGSQARPIAGVQDFADIRAALLASGARTQEHVVGEWTVTRTLARQLETIEHRTWAAGPEVSPDVYARGLAELRAWTVATFGGLDQGYAVTHRFVWQSYTWPDPAGEA